MAGKVDLFYLGTSYVLSDITEIQSESSETVSETNEKNLSMFFGYFRIKTLINDRQAYLITGVSHIDDLHISEYLDIPIYGLFKLFESPLDFFVHRL